MNARSVSLLALSVLLGACAAQQQAVDSQAGKPVRVCTQDEGCSDQAKADPRAAFDLALRFFRGDGVRRDSYKALTWMRDSAERGNTKAQVALGRLYLSGFEEMGSDPAEAESWLLAAAGKGDPEAKKLLEEAQKAKKDEAEYRRWVNTHRALWMGYWWNAYHYYTYWQAGYWYYY